MPENPTVVFPSPGEVTVENRPVPEPEAGEVVVESTQTLISTGTEVTLLSGDYPPDSNWGSYEFPFEPGYCTVGRIVEMGGGVAQFDVDDRVVLRGKHSRYNLASAEACIPVPDAVSDDEAVFSTIAEIVTNGVRRGDVDWGEAAVVYGAGLLGQFAVRLCHLAGCRPVVGVDLASDRLEYLPDEPGVHAVDPTVDEPEEIVRQANHDRLADVVFEVTGNPDVITDELTVLREQGRFVLLSSPRGETAFNFHDQCNAPSYEIVGAHASSTPSVGTPSDPWTRRRNCEVFFEYVADESMSVDDLVSHRGSLADAPELYDVLLEDRSQAMGVVLE